MRGVPNEWRIVSAESRPMAGRVCVVTGATAGIGKETALALAKMGATVVIVARDTTRAARTAEEISRAAHNPAMSWVIADFASLDSVRKGAAELIQRHEAIHVLVNNAGVAKKQRTLSVDGIELTLAVNHLAPFLLTRELLPLLRAGSPSRIVTVASAAEAHRPIDFADLQSEKKYRGYTAYAKTKLMNVMFTYELSTRLAGSGVTANCVHPGAVATDMLRQLPWWLYGLMSPFLLTPEQGAAAPVYLASSPEVEGVSGDYFVRQRAKPSSLPSYDVDARKRLWDMSEALIDSHSGP
ncbi:MAG TPA: SDR family oxidoreductase [Gemmatimonadaceae bacterium]|jgi:NAD(P)-dependent dehydrogenase (short-subunit alcohol dehydrogenase family)